jgi:hypothetical protein
MNRGLSRRNVFLEDKDREGFLELLGETSRQWKAEILVTVYWITATIFCFKPWGAGLSLAMVSSASLG